jgi:hypothetical protein
MRIVIDVYILPAWKGAIVKDVYKLMQEVRAPADGHTTHSFSGKPLRASEGIRYDAGLFGRGDKRSRTIFDAEAGA